MQHNINVMAQSVEIEVSDHHETFLIGILEIRRDKRFFDIKLCVGDKEIDSHKAVLAAFSPYFSGYFDDDFLKSGQDRIDLTDKTNMTVLKSILDYMYSGSISFLIKDGAMLMRTLNFFKMQSVTDLCETYLVENIDTENYVDFLNFAEKVPLARLKKAALDYIKNNFRQIYDSYEFKKLTKDQLESVIQKTRDDDAEITCEAIVGWIKHDTPSRKDYVGELLKYVSIKNLTTSYYWAYIGKDDFLKNNAAGRQWRLDSFLDHPESPFRPHPTIHIMSNCDYSHYEWDVCDKSLRTLKLSPQLNYSAMVKHKKEIYDFNVGDDNEIEPIGFKYDTTTNKWTRFAVGNILIKQCSGICSHGDGIYLIGGFENNQRQNTCVLYDVATSQWTALPDMKYARIEPGVVSCNSSIYVFGGYLSDSSGTLVERYDPREGKWFNHSRINLQSPGSAAVVSEYNVCCMDGSCGKLINFDTRSSKCTDVTSKQGYSLASLDGRLYIGHDDGIAEYNPYSMEWNEVLQKSLALPILIA